MADIRIPQTNLSYRGHHGLSNHNTSRPANGIVQRLPTKMTGKNHKNAKAANFTSFGDVSSVTRKRKIRYSDTANFIVFYQRQSHLELKQYAAGFAKLRDARHACVNRIGKIGFHRLLIVNQRNGQVVLDRTGIRNAAMHVSELIGLD